MDLSQALLTGRGVELGEALAAGGMVTGLGLTIVFSVLIILMIVLYLFKLIFYKGNKTEKPAAAPNAAPVEKEEAINAVKEDMDEEELIAILTAAVAASLNTSTYNLHIKSYRRINNNVPAWNKAGVNETINSRLF